MNWESILEAVLSAVATAAAFLLLAVVEARTARLAPLRQGEKTKVRVALAQRLFFYSGAGLLIAFFAFMVVAWALEWGTPDLEVGHVLLLGLFFVPVSYCLLLVGTRWYSWDDQVARTGTDVTRTRTFHWSNLISSVLHKSGLSYVLDFGEEGKLTIDLKPTIFAR